MARILLDAKRLSEELKRRLTPIRNLQRQVVEDTGLQQGTVSNLLRGKFKVLSDRVRQICEYADIDPMKFVLASASPAEAEFRAAIQAIEKLGPSGAAGAKLVLKALHTVLSRAE